MKKREKADSFMCVLSKCAHKMIIKSHFKGTYFISYFSLSYFACETACAYIKYPHLPEDVAIIKIRRLVNVMDMKGVHQTISNQSCVKTENRRIKESEFGFHFYSQ